jgi:hypothetical protein
MIRHNKISNYKTDHTEHIQVYKCVILLITLGQCEGSV